MPLETSKPRLFLAVKGLLNPVNYAQLHNFGLSKSRSVDGGALAEGRQQQHLEKPKTSAVRISEVFKQRNAAEAQGMMIGGLAVSNFTHVRTENGPCPSALTGQLVKGQPLFLIQEHPVPKALHLGREVVQKSCNARPKVVEIKSN